MDKKPSSKKIFLLYLFILLLWGFYRANIFLPEWVEEAFLKPVIFLGPILWWVAKIEKRSLSSLGFTSKNFFKACYLGIGLGLAFSLVALLANIAKYGRLSTVSFGLEGTVLLLFLVLNLVTSFSEVTLFFGFILTRLKSIWTDEIKVIFTTGLLFSLIHLPIVIFVYHYQFLQILSYFLLTFCIGFGNAILMLRTNNLIAPILAQTFWGVSIYLFR